MKKIFAKIKGAFGSKEDYEDIEKEAESEGGEYVEIDSSSIAENKKKVTVRTFCLEDFENVKEILDYLRDGDTIALINIKPLKEKDIIELKRAINKIKKTCDAIEGEIAGFGEDYIVVTPSFAKIERNKQTKDVEEENK